MDIIKRGKYYYLGNSFRLDGKVVYREKYLGKQVPKDIGEIKEDFFRLCNAEIYKKLNRIKRAFQKEWKSFPESIKRKHLIELSIDMTYNTNAIEGSKITREETEDIITHNISPRKSIDDVKESINHSKVFFEVLQERKELSSPMLLQWHRALFGETKGDIAGTFREYSVRVSGYRAPDWQDLPQLLDDYFKWYTPSKDVLHPIELAARMHYRFEKIHPFGDGNGRIGRLIIVYILTRANCPILVIEHKKRKSYYHALEKDEYHFLQYVIRRYLRAFNTYLS